LIFLLLFGSLKRLLKLRAVALLQKSNPLALEKQV